MRIKSYCIITGICFFAGLLTTSQAYTEVSTPAKTSEGEKMETKLWQDVKNKDWKTVEDQIAPEFQSVHSDGARNRAQEIELIKNLDISPYKLFNFKTTQQGDTIIVTYFIAVQETINQEELEKAPEARLSVWQKGTNGWQWIAHANLTPIPSRD